MWTYSLVPRNNHQVDRYTYILYMNSGVLPQVDIIGNKAIILTKLTKLKLELLKIKLEITSNNYCEFFSLIWR